MEDESEDESDTEDVTTRKKGTKRVKLENLILNLSIEEKERQENEMVPRKEVTNYHGTPRSSDLKLKFSKLNSLKKNDPLDDIPSVLAAFANSNLDSDVARMLQMYHERQRYFSNRLLKWCHPICVVIFHFHNWCLRNVNSFVKKYNERNPVDKIPIFRTYERLENYLKLKRKAIKTEDFWTIVLYENLNEQKALLQKRRNKDDKESTDASFEQLEEELGDVRYNYWDRNTENDIDMEQ